MKADRNQEPGFYIQEGKYDSSAVQGSIQREDSKIMDSVLASFLDIGLSKAGGNSQNEGQMEMFLNSLLYIADYIAKARDTLAHSYYVLNFGEPKVTLTTTVTGITRKDAQKTMEIIRGYVQSDVLRADEVLEKSIRHDLKLPEKDEKTERDNVSNPDKNTFRTAPGEEKPQKKPAQPKKDGK